MEARGTPQVTYRCACRPLVFIRVRARSSRTSTLTVIPVRVSGAQFFERITRSGQKNPHAYACDERVWQGELAPVFFQPTKAAHPFVIESAADLPLSLPSLCTTRRPRFASQPQDNTVHGFRLETVHGARDWSRPCLAPKIIFRFRSVRFEISLFWLRLLCHTLLPLVKAVIGVALLLLFLEEGPCFSTASYWKGRTGMRATSRPRRVL